MFRTKCQGDKKPTFTKKVGFSFSKENSIYFARTSSQEVSYPAPRRAT
ncbi:hypothetical protein RUMCAL_02383 [Ruminococcus callidus ATCC 27760]|uniref:Uncharacterized protein n=1 Tax=Ruminococcus callidus ATCC 27760 TaxID=411473 RepID=U2LSX5_9FIRM|nr:hypothetical protein RUMCAL_02383 [Ruminococcus callidus ATCC 27760]